MKRFFGILIILLILAVLPKVLGTYYVTLVTQILISAIFAISLDLLIGYLDLPSLGHAAFFGVAAYTIGILLKRSEPFLVKFSARYRYRYRRGRSIRTACFAHTGAYFFMITVALAEVLGALRSVGVS
jgi:branched-chain amino acid transport system permease protein